MNDFFHILIVVLAIMGGLALLASVFLSIIRVAVLNRHKRDLFALIVGRLTYRIIYNRSWDEKYDKVHKGKLWFLPLFIILLVANWVITVMVAYACFYWATGSEPNFLLAIISSGSALSTLGFHTPQTSLGALLSISEGAIGLFIVVFILSFIPGYLANIQSRDTQVGWLYARTSTKISGSQLIKWYYANDQAEGLSRVWEIWENWFRNLGMTNDLSPNIALVPSFTHGYSWLLASTAVLDAASLACSVLNTNYASANLCYEAGVQAMQLIVESSLWPKSKKLVKTSSMKLTRANFEDICEELAHFNVPLKLDREQAWRDFLNRRNRYEPLVLEIGKGIQTPGILEMLKV